MRNISQEQNKPTHLEQLAAQKQIYSDIKFWMLLSLIIGVAIPLITSVAVFISNQDFVFNKISQYINLSKDTVGIVSGLIGFFAVVFVEITSTLLISSREKAAKIQELFDIEVFGLEWNETVIGEKPAHTDIYNYNRKYLKKASNHTKFVDWYTTKASHLPYPKSIIFCQQENLCWDKSLRDHIILKSVITIIVLVSTIIMLGIVGDFSFRNTFTNIILLTAPICLFFYKVIIEHRNTNVEIERLKSINTSVIDKILVNSINNNEVLIQARTLQTAIYNHRKSARPIPDWLHLETRQEKEDESKDRIQKYIDRYNANP